MVRESAQRGQQYLPVHGDVKADPIELEQGPVEPSLGVPVVGGSSVGDTGHGSKPGQLCAGSGPVAWECWSHMPVHTMRPPAGWDTGDAAAWHQQWGISIHSAPSLESLEACRSQCVQFRVSTAMSCHMSLPSSRKCLHSSKQSRATGCRNYHSTPGLLSHPAVPAAPFRAPIRKTGISNNHRVLNLWAHVAIAPASSPEIVPPVLQAEGVLRLAAGCGAIQVTVPLNANSDAPSLQNTLHQRFHWGLEI